MARADGVVCLAAAALAACAAPAYSPCPLDLGHALPADAFARCRDVLLRRYDALTESDPQSFRLQTDWAPSQDPPGERRASVYLDPVVDDSLAVVVELRYLRLPSWFGLPGWTSPRGDAAAERELVEELRAALADPDPVGFTN